MKATGQDRVDGHIQPEKCALTVRNFASFYTHQIEGHDDLQQTATRTCPDQHKKCTLYLQRVR